MLTQISVLGGSSPFTAAFIDALLPFAHVPCRLVLHGRDAANVELVAEYGRRHLQPHGWQVLGTTHRKRALEGARIVIHQIRYGGMSGRERDEEIAVRFGAPPDETLGPGALHSILRSLPDLKKTAQEIVESCPDAWVLNLTNPLSVVTAVMIEAGVKRCAGLCELPLVTARESCDALQIPFQDVDWKYAGLNHRGFVTELGYGGRNMIPELAGRLESRTIGGITAADIAEFEAVPTKYFLIISGRERPHGGPGRAAYLDSLRDQISLELKSNPEMSPPSLRKRYLEWYPQSVVPMIAALLSEKATLQTVNVPVDSGLVEERQAWVSSGSFELQPEPPATAAVARWLAIYRAHEEVILRCVREPSPRSIAEALMADPVVDRPKVEEIAEVLWDSYEDRSAVGAYQA